MIKRSFFGLSLKDKQRFVFKQQQELIGYIITGIVPIQDDETKIYGLKNNEKILITKISKGISNIRCKFTIDENNYTTIFCLGNENTNIQLNGYKLEYIKKKESNNHQQIKSQQQQPIEQKENKKIKENNNLIFNDEFRALQPVPERILDEDEFNLLSKADKKEYKRKQKLLTQQQPLE